MPGDWVEARFFSWVFDVADVKLEADGSSTLGKNFNKILPQKLYIIVTLTMNENSPTLVDGEWSEFFFGYDGAAEHVANGDTDNYKVGILPTEGSSDPCIMDVNDVRPPESQSRALPRKQRREKLRATAKAWFNDMQYTVYHSKQRILDFYYTVQSKPQSPNLNKAERTEKVASFWAEYSKTVENLKSDYTNTVFIPASNNKARNSYYEGQDDETVFIPANRG